MGRNVNDRSLTRAKSRIASPVKGRIARWFVRGTVILFVIVAYATAAGSAYAHDKQKTFNNALAAAQQHVPNGKLMDAEDEVSNGASIIDFLFLDDGRVRSVRVDAETTRVLTVDGHAPIEIQPASSAHKSLWDRFIGFFSGLKIETNAEFGRTDSNDEDRSSGDDDDGGRDGDGDEGEGHE